MLQRAAKLRVGLFEPPHYLAFQGATRTLLGAVFGAFVFASVTAGFLLSLALNDPWAMMALSFIGGVSERFVPELLKDIEDHQRTLEVGRQERRPTD